MRRMPRADWQPQHSSIVPKLPRANWQSQLSTMMMKSGGIFISYVATWCMTEHDFLLRQESQSITPFSVIRSTLDSGLAADATLWCGNRIMFFRQRVIGATY